MIFQRLRQFRQSIYDLLGRGQDVLFELMDAALTTSEVTSLVRLSQNPLFRRQWPSLYSALKAARVSRTKLMKQLLAEVSCDDPPLLAGDATLWLRPAAKTLKERTFGRGSHGSIGVGQSYSTLAWIPEAEGSWALPLRHERITSFETPVSKGAFQLKQVCRYLLVRPLVAYDRAYGNGRFVKATAEVAADLLLRLPSNRCVWGAPPPYSGRGAPPKHGVKFKLSAPETWPVDDETIEVNDPKLGRVKVTRWHRYHFRNSPKRPMDILRVEVLQPNGRRRKFTPLWLAWVREHLLALEQLWHKYLRRFALEHWYRFAKQRLHWTLPQVTTQAAMDAWSHLIVLMSWQLWLARDECSDSPLPWQAAQDKLSPGRVAQAFAVILAAIGTPAKAPKTRGKAPGWPKHKPRTPRQRYPIVKKRASKRKKSFTSPPSTQPRAA